MDDGLPSCYIFECHRARSSLLNRVSQFGTVAKVSSMPGQTKQAAWSHGCDGSCGISLGRLQLAIVLLSHEGLTFVNSIRTAMTLQILPCPTHKPNPTPSRPISSRYRNRKVRLDFIDMPGYGHSARAKVFGPEALEFVRNRHLGGNGGELWAGQKAGKVGKK